MIRYQFHPEALADLDEIYEFIAADNPSAADRTISKILEGVEALTGSPHRGHRRSDLTPQPFRFAGIGEYLVAYVPDSKPLWVLAVIHGRRSPRVMAAILRGRES